MLPPAVEDGVRAPGARAVLLAALVALAASCASAPRSNAPCGGALGPTAPWCIESDFPGTLPPATPDAVDAVVAAILAACPPATADDPTPGLSAAARWTADRMPRRNLSPRALRLEIVALEPILAGLPAGDPDCVRVLVRLAGDYPMLEVLDYRDCRAASVPAAPSAYDFAWAKDRALDIVRSLREAREGGQRACALLRRDYPSLTPTEPCSR